MGHLLFDDLVSGGEQHRRHLSPVLPLSMWLRNLIAGKFSPVRLLQATGHRRFELEAGTSAHWFSERSFAQSETT